eukprot:1980568-Prymnesium_polylepis.2
MCAAVTMIVTDSSRRRSLADRNIAPQSWSARLSWWLRQKHRTVPFVRKQPQRPPIERATAPLHSGWAVAQCASRTDWHRADVQKPGSAIGVAAERRRSSYSGPPV